MKKQDIDSVSNIIVLFRAGCPIESRHADLQTMGDRMPLERRNTHAHEMYFSYRLAVHKTRRGTGGCDPAPHLERAAASYGDVAKNVQMPEAVQRQMAKMPLQSLLKQAGKAVPPAMIQQLNAALNKIKKES